MNSTLDILFKKLNLRVNITSEIQELSCKLTQRPGYLSTAKVYSRQIAKKHKKVIIIQTGVTRLKEVNWKFRDLLLDADDDCSIEQPFNNVITSEVYLRVSWKYRRSWENTIHKWRLPEPLFSNSNILKRVNLFKSKDFVLDEFPSNLYDFLLRLAKDFELRGRWSGIDVPELNDFLEIVLASHRPNFQPKILLFELGVNLTYLGEEQVSWNPKK